MLTRKMLIVSAMLTAGVLYAENIELKTTESWCNPKNVKIVEDGVLEITDRNMLYSATTFKIDTTKTYKISGELRQTTGEKNWTHIGFTALDEKKLNIPALSYNAILGTDTELVEDLKPTDTTLKVKDASKWGKIASHYSIVLNTNYDYSDLPNSNYIACGITHVKKNSDVWTVTLDKPAQKAAKSGTNVRLHGGGGYVYTAGIHGTTTSDDWKKFSGSIKGHATYGCNSYKTWPPGATYARVIILANWRSSPAILQLRNVKLEVID